MELPVEMKPAILGAVAGAVVMAMVGFTWGGWVTRGGMETIAKQASVKAANTALAPICVENFRRSADAANQLLELRKISSWQQSSFIEKGGWAKMPGTASVDSGLISACAEMILAAKT